MAQLEKRATLRTSRSQVRVLLGVRAPLAQRVELPSLKRKVRGSSPRRRTRRVEQLGVLAGFIGLRSRVQIPPLQRKQPASRGRVGRGEAAAGDAGRTALESALLPRAPCNEGRAATKAACIELVWRESGVLQRQGRREGRAATKDKLPRQHVHAPQGSVGCSSAPHKGGLPGSTPGPATNRTPRPRATARLGPVGRSGLVGSGFASDRARHSPDQVGVHVGWGAARAARRSPGPAGADRYVVVRSQPPSM